MKRYSALASILSGTFILMLIAFYNGYPLVYSDTGTYIWSGFRPFIPVDRPVFYGLFVRHISLAFSLWPVILVQNFITSWVIYEVVAHFFPVHKRWHIFLLVISGLTFLTGAAWYSNQIMPDFMTPLVILIMYLLLSAALVRWKVWVFSFILIFCLVSHFSHVIIAFALLFLLLIFKTFRRKNIFRYQFIQKTRLWLCICLTVVALLIFPVTNYVANGHFVVSEGSHVFYMSHLVDTGILEKLLKENCGNPELKDCTLCRMKDSLPHDAATFIWSGKYLERSGGWKASREEYSRIIRFSLKHETFLAMTIYKDFIYSLVQLASNEIGSGLSPYVEESAPYSQIKDNFPTELNNYLNSKQNVSEGTQLNFDFVNQLNYIFLGFVLVFLIFIFSGSLSKSFSPATMGFIIFMLAGIIINAVVTASLTNAYNRYEARVVWLAELAVAIAVMLNWKELVSYFREQYP
jgi:hypothetical protein